MVENRFGNISRVSIGPVSGISFEVVVTRLGEKMEKYIAFEG